MTFEPYQPIPAGELGLGAAVGMGTGDCAQTLQLAIEGIIQTLKQMNFTGEVEFYSSTNDPKAQDGKIGLGFLKHNLSLAPADWPHWQNYSMETIRQESQCWGAVKYANGRPISLLEPRPQSPFIALLAQEFADLTIYWQQFDPLLVGPLTEWAFLELPARSCLVQKQQFDYIVAAGDDTRLIQWLELPDKAKSNTWYVFRNKAHFDAWLDQKSRFEGQNENYPLEPTGFDPFYLDSSENLSRQREAFLSGEKPPSREA